MKNKVNELLSAENKKDILEGLIELLRYQAMQVQIRNADFIEAEYQYPEQYEYCQQLLMCEIELYMIIRKCKEDVEGLYRIKRRGRLVELRLQMLINEIDEKEREILRNLKYVGE